MGLQQFFLDFPATMDNATQDLLAALAAAQPKWRATTQVEKSEVARAMQACVQADGWSKGWLGKEAKLLKIDHSLDAAGRSLLSSERFVFGSIANDFLTTFIAAAKPGAAFPGAVQTPGQTARNKQVGLSPRGHWPLVTGPALVLAGHTSSH